MYIIRLLNQIKQNTLAKKKYFYFYNIKNIQPFVNKLVELSIISIKTHNAKTLKVYLIYDENNNVLFKNIKIMYFKSRPLHVNIKTLKKLKKYQHNSCYILTTSYGLKTNFEALTLNCGGLLICKFNY